MTIAVIGACILQDFLEGSTIVVIFSWSAYIETRASARATAAIKEILDLSPPTASVIVEVGRESACDNNNDNNNDNDNDGRNNSANFTNHEKARMRRVEVDVHDVAVGSLLAVLPGEKVPIDGDVESGSSTLDESR